MKKKVGIIFIIVFIIFVLAMITNYADTARVTTGHEPKFCIKMVSRNESKVTYWGMGYKVIRYVGVSPNEPYESNIGVKMGNWFMQYEMPKEDDEYCTTDHSFEIGGDALTKWRCNLCGKVAINSTTNTPELCENCAQKTGRCEQCGKLKQ